MEEIQVKKSELREETTKKLAALPEKEIVEKTKAIENRLFDFANFLESKIALMYVHNKSEVPTGNILRRSYDYNKIVVLPAYNTENFDMTPMKVDNLDTDLQEGPRGILEPDEARCKVVPIERIDIAIIPAIALDEKGGRIGSGEGYYDRLIPRLAITTRKVALALEDQIIPQVPIESHDRHVDIIITEDRVIYKI
jgi:5-formyltetrahydrofolate cyclo-ligase